MYTVSTLDSDQNVTPNNYHHGNLRETLIEQGLDLLEKKQNTDFSMRELTRLIGVSANAVYRHFANKEELLTALAIHGFEKLLTEQAHLVIEKQTIQQAFLGSGREYVNFAMTHPALFRLMYGRFAQEHQDDRLKALSRLAYQGMLFAVANALKLDPKSHNAQIIATKSWSVVHGLSHLMIDGQFDHLTHQQKMHMIEEVLATTYRLDV
jgi:AcrR family transcriptional regulator